MCKQHRVVSMKVTCTQARYPIGLRDLGFDNAAEARQYLMDVVEYNMDRLHPQHADKFQLQDLQDGFVVSYDIEQNGNIYLRLTLAAVAYQSIELELGVTAKEPEWISVIIKKWINGDYTEGNKYLQ
ncbi:hypothetical protein [Pseudomonas aeruginosa]|uniref:hypothetical protein n=1 Tax=Pseudomonas aeruginosa TaxID=287 RepID=UPI001CA4938B|nr:hypothetical protein [Pseudomonas aeruginosa]MBW6071818.1 hypothetical protein [Pseudomonas aeruginosa]